MRRATHFACYEGAGIKSMHAALRWRAAERPDAAALIVLRDGEVEDRIVTYAELEADALRLAAGLARRFRPGARIALAFPAGAGFVEALFACFFAGLIAAPAPPPRKGRASHRLRAIVHDCQAAAVLTEPDLAELCDGCGAAVLTREDLSEAGSPAVEADTSIALLQYTSGSTGDPKGAILTHDAIWANEAVIRTCFGHEEGVRLVGWLPNYHDMGLIGNLLQPLYCGGVSVILAPQAFLQRPLRWLRAITRYRAHTSGGPNFAYELCLRAAREAELGDLDLSSWRVAFNGAEPVRAGTLQSFAARFAEFGLDPGALYPCYGLAESTLMVAGASYRAGARILSASRAALARERLAPAADAADARLVVSCGAEVAGTDLRIVDTQSCIALGEGEVGELWVRSPSLASGYWGRRADCFEGELTGVGSGFLRTGDLGARRGGELYVLGRCKDLLIQDGRNLHPSDIEAAAERALAVVPPNGAAAFAVETERGEEIHLALEVARTAIRGLDARGAGARVRAAVAREAEAALAGVHFLKPGALPKTSSGKVQRARCRELFLAGELALIAPAGLA